jgi:glycosyltransferase involved in cell wall biosynthesis
MQILAQEPLVSVVLPVYNRHQYLGQAIDSVLAQTYKNWELIIADDASDNLTKEFLEKYKKKSKLTIYRNSKNMGLFPNLNKSISRCNGNYILLLCSDDYLLPDCLYNYINLIREYADAKLILSKLGCVNSLGNKLPDPSYIRLSNNYDHFPEKTQLLPPDKTLPLLLQYGSINGNLTGMFFNREVYEQVGNFNETCQQVADWEWLYRVAKFNPILIYTETLAVIRSHPEQLSGVNFRNLSNSLEVAEMVTRLLADPYISQLKAAPCWALHIMQLHLWFAFKLAFQGHWTEALIITKAVGRTTGFTKTLWSMLRWLPQRLQVYRMNKKVTQIQVS